MTFISDIWIKLTTGISTLLIGLATTIAPNSVPVPNEPSIQAESAVVARATAPQVTESPEVPVSVETKPRVSSSQKTMPRPLTEEAKPVAPGEPKSLPFVTEETPPITVRSNIRFSVHEREVKNESSYPAQGIYTLYLDITAGKQDILIPLTTTDSTKGQTGISYSVNGDRTFSGERKSDIKCTSGIAYGNDCVIKAGTTEHITATIWLVPVTDGTFGVTFNNLGYKVVQGGDLKKYPINEVTEQVYIQF